MKKGFTLIEMLGVIAILAILATIITPTIENTLRKNKQKLQTTNLNMIKQALKDYMAEQVFIVGDYNYEIRVSYIQLVEEGLIKYENPNPSSKNKYYNPYNVLVVTKDDNGINYTIPDYSNSITKQDLDSLPYCTISNSMDNTYTKASITCDNTVTSVEPTTSSLQSNNLHIYNVGTNMNLYQNIME